MRLKLLLRELKSLKLPWDRLAITCSGPLGARQLREINDLDVILMPDLWNNLSKVFPVTNNDGYHTIYTGNLQILGKDSWFSNNVFGTAEKQINEADMIEGVRYVKLWIIRHLKQQMGRPKDLEDIKLIDKYWGTGNS